MTKTGKFDTNKRNLHMMNSVEIMTYRVIEFQQNCVNM